MISRHNGDVHWEFDLEIILLLIPNFSVNFLKVISHTTPLYRPPTTAPTHTHHSIIILFIFSPPLQAFLGPYEQHLLRVWHFDPAIPVIVIIPEKEVVGFCGIDGGVGICECLILIGCQREVQVCWVFGTVTCTGEVNSEGDVAVWESAAHPLTHVTTTTGW